MNGKYTSYSVNYYSITGKKDQIESTVLRKKIKKEKYVGRIYCVTVPNHTLYVRRNGKSYWCGNSHLGDIEQLDGVFNVLSSDPDLKDKFKVIIAGCHEGNCRSMKGSGFAASRADHILADMASLKGMIQHYNIAANEPVKIARLISMTDSEKEVK